MRTSIRIHCVCHEYIMETQWKSILNSIPMQLIRPNKLKLDWTRFTGRLSNSVWHYSIYCYLSKLSWLYFTWNFQIVKGTLFLTLFSAFLFRPVALWKWERMPAGATTLWVSPKWIRPDRLGSPVKVHTGYWIWLIDNLPDLLILGPLSI